MKRGFLEQNWTAINTPKAQAGLPAGVAAEGFLRPWTHDNVNMDMIERAIKILKPMVVLDLGTFEAMGTIRMARAMDEYVKSGSLFTFDVGHSPANSLGAAYGCPPAFEDSPIVDWKGFDPQHPCATGWKSWERVMQARDERLATKFNNVTITFIQGLTYDTLPAAMPHIGAWGFCFQDTLHTTPHIIREWKLYRDYARVNSVAVFDDIGIHNMDFVDWMKENEPSWALRHTELGHGQLWVERVKA